jgi:hypothetical protein
VRRDAWLFALRAVLLDGAAVPVRHAVRLAVDRWGAAAVVVAFPSDGVDVGQSVAKLRRCESLASAGVGAFD